jgi:hypothetical protein
MTSPEAVIDELLISLFLKSESPTICVHVQTTDITMYSMPALAVNYQNRKTNSSERKREKNNARAPLAHQPPANLFPVHRTHSSKSKEQ